MKSTLGIILVLASAGGMVAAHSAVSTRPAAAAAPGSERDPRPALLEAARAAGGGWNTDRMLILEGSVEAGGGQGTIHQVIALRPWFSRSDMDMGQLHDVSGFDGIPWTSQNGIVTTIDLPSLVQDARANAFVDAAGWTSDEWRLAGAKVRMRAVGAPTAMTFRPVNTSPVTVWLDDATHLARKIEIDTDGGKQATDLSDYRLVDGLRIPFLRRTTDPTGAVTVVTIRSAKLAPLNALSVVRPPVQPRGRLASSLAAPVQFEFSASDRGHIVVPALVNDRAVKLIFDTGGANYFSPDWAQKLELRSSGGVIIGGVGEGSVNGGFAPVRAITIGGATLQDEQAIVGPLPYTANHPRRGVEAAGLTGYEFLSEFKTSLDYQRRTISFAPFGPPERAGSATLPFRSDGHSIYVTAKVDGIEGIFRVDTGDGGALTVSRQFVDRHHLRVDGARIVREAGGVGGTVRAVQGRVRRFVLAGTAFADVPVSVSDTRSGGFFSRSIAGNLGFGILRRFNITFDYRNRLLTLRPNAFRSVDFARERSGLSVTQSSATAIEVLSVAAGSPAAAVGIVPGDRIVAINGQSVERERLGALDLTPLVFGRAAFELTLDRGGKPARLRVEPRDFRSTGKSGR